MKKMLGAMLLLVCATTAWSQPPRTRVVTHPTLPNREMLRRMEMDLRWHLKIPDFDELRDGIFAVQVIPGDLNTQLIVQTIQGEVILLDGETGTIVWRTKLTRVPTAAMFPCAFNSHSIYVVRDNALDILDRGSGIRLLYSYDPMTKVRSYFSYALYDTTPKGAKLATPRPPIAKPYATPVADEDFLFYTAGDRVVSLKVPNYKVENEPYPIDASSKKPSVNWILFTGQSGVKHAPIVTTTQVGIVKVDGTFQSLEKDKEGIRFTFKAAGRVGAAMGVHSVYNLTKQEASAYVCSEDQSLYSIDLFKKRENWRFVSPGPIRRKPYVTDRDVFIKVEKGGFFRIDRADGKEIWSNRQALQFMACNRLFVYTRDATGSLLIHDYIRGTTLAEWDFRDWGISVPNELTDRIYLAHNDGQLLCLNNHDYPRAQFMKVAPFEIPRPKAKAK